MKHTPPPWRCLEKEHSRTFDGSFWHIEAGKGFYASAEDEFYGEPDDGFSLAGFMSEANARLIAAAPEMLEALKMSTLYMANTAGGQCRNTGLHAPLGISPGGCTCVRCDAKRKLESVRSIIAKAEGRS